MLMSIIPDMGYLKLDSSRLMRLLLSASFAVSIPAYLYRFSRDIPILALNHDFPISCGGVPILEDAGIFRAFRFRFVLLSPVFPNPPRILHLPPVKALRCRYK